MSTNKYFDEVLEYLMRNSPRSVILKQASECNCVTKITGQKLKILDSQIRKTSQDQSASNAKLRLRTDCEQTQECKLVADSCRVRQYHQVIHLLIRERCDRQLHVFHRDITAQLVFPSSSARHQNTVDKHSIVAVLAISTVLVTSCFQMSLRHDSAY